MKPEITDEIVEKAARSMCRSNGTAQCAAICLSRFASDNQDGKCADAKYVYGRSARAALEAVAPMIRAEALEEAAAAIRQHPLRGVDPYEVTEARTSLCAAIRKLKETPHDDP